MEPYENDELRQEEGHNEPQPEEHTEPQPEVHEEPAYAPQPSAESAYRGAGVGRKESPFADSPYVMYHRNEQQSGNAYAAQSTSEKKQVRKKKGGIWKTLLAAVLIFTLVAGSCSVTASIVNQRWEYTTRQMTDDFNTKLDDLQSQIDEAARTAENAMAGNSVSGSPVASGNGMTPGQVYAQNVDSVVLITCEVTESVYGQTTNGTSAGSGFILSEDGYVVTNQHVVDGATAIYVSTYDGKQYPAQLVGSDETNDVAVVKVEAEGLPAVTIGRSSDLIVGDQVVAIGNPLGELTSTMTAGYVSAMNRDVTTEGRTINMIQTDAAINSGNSGGPLFNMKGEVVGITTAKYSGASSSGASIEGIGFAIPMDDVVGLVEDLVNYGYVTGAYLGVMVSDMDPAAAEYYGMPVGAYVQEVVAGNCAAAAGVQPKDIIVAVGEYEVKNISGLSRALRNFKAGDTTTITVFRAGEELVLTITLDAKPDTTETEIPSPEQLPGAGEMPEDGSYEEWYNYFAPFFGKDEDGE